jgi:hypothetical protein
MTSPDPDAGAGSELAELLPAITGTAGQFGHRQHIHLAFVAVRRYGMPAAVGKVCGWLRQLTAYAQAPQKYHHTVSRAWVELVAYHADTDPGCADFEVFAGRYPALLDKRLLSRHYRSSTLASGPARQGWVEPDLLAFPWSGRDHCSDQQNRDHHGGHHEHDGGQGDHDRAPAQRRPAAG